MNKSTSIYLDIVRFLAAISVYLQHYNDWSGERIPVFKPMQTHAVILFFCLSGFVINFAIEKESYKPINYALNRFTRIASVAFPAILFTLTLDTLGSLYHPEIYGPWSLPDKLTQLGYGVTFLNEIWGTHALVGFNPPYWSMGYEVPYYVIFGAAIFTRGFWRIGAVAALLLIVGPRIALLMGTWLIGIGAYQICKAKRISPVFGALILVVGAGGWVALYWAQLQGIWPATLRPVNWHRSEIATDYLIAALFAATIIGVSAIDRQLLGLANAISKPVRWIAGATFTIYLFHWPIAMFLMRFTNIDPRNDLSGVGLTVIVLGLCFLIASVTERKKDSFKRAIEGLLGISGGRAA